MRERHGHLREAHLDCGWAGRSCYLWLAGTRGVPGRWRSMDRIRPGTRAGVIGVLGGNSRIDRW